MAQKRMFSLQIVDTDAFLEMPATSQLLYFHLVMRSDDEGFIGNPKKIMRLIGGQEDDLKVLIAKRFLLIFESGVVVVKHWLIHNTIRMDRFNQTTYQDEKNRLILKDNKSYSELATSRQPNGNHLEPQVKLSEVKLSKLKLSESTPAQEAENFFKNAAVQLEIFNEICPPGNVYRELVGQEIAKFIEYWTELNKSGTKQRWEQEATFEIKRRLKKWLGNVKNFNKPNQTNAIII